MRGETGSFMLQPMKKKQGVDDEKEEKSHVESRGNEQDQGPKIVFKPLQSATRTTSN